MYRIYIEDFTEPIWAVDTGDGTAVRRFSSVIIEVFCLTKYKLKNDNIASPKAWIEVPSAEFKIVNNIAILR